MKGERREEMGERGKREGGGGGVGEMNNTPFLRHIKEFLTLCTYLQKLEISRSTPPSPVDVSVLSSHCPCPTGREHVSLTLSSSLLVCAI